MVNISAYYRFSLLDEEIRKSNKIRSKKRLDCTAHYDTKGRLTKFVNSKKQLFLYKTDARHIVKADSKRLADFVLNNSTGGNFTSLYYDDIDYPQYAYGYPQKSKGGQFCNDGYLFIINDDMTEIEVFIIHNGRNLISAYYQELIEGNFGHCIKAIRSKGKVFYDYWSSNSI